MTVRALYFDLDGTLLDEDHRVPTPLSKAIDKARARGLMIGVATGRRGTTTLPYAEAIEANAPLVLFNGARVVTSDFKNALFHTTLPRVSSLKVIERVLAFGTHIGAYVDERMLVDERLPMPKASPANSALSSREEVDLLKLEKAPVKLLFVDEPERLRELRRLLTVERLIPPGAHLVRSNPRYLELLPDGVNKGQGLLRCANHLGLDVRDIACFGDDENDREMLEVCGFGVAMAHGPESVRHAADKVIDRTELAALVDSF